VNVCGQYEDEWRPLIYRIGMAQEALLLGHM